MTRTRLFVLGGLLILVLGLLASGLAGIQFRGGTRGGEPVDLWGEPGGVIPFGAPEWILDVIVIVFFVLLGARVVLALVSRRGSRVLLRRVGVLALATLLMLLLLTVYRSPHPPAEEEAAEEEVAGDVAAPSLSTPSQGEAREGSEPPRAPGWAVYLAAGIVGAGLAWWLVRRFTRRAPTQAEEIRDAVASASADLARGLPVSDVVIRCWLRMVEVLSRHATGADAPAVTPREFADRLVRLGFREEAVRVLTGLFEEVRYGHKESEPRRAEAVAALAAIERAYG